MVQPQDPLSFDPSSPPRWYALYTRSRFEKKMLAALSERGIEVFLPMREVVSRWKDRKKKVWLPLFPGYLFVHHEDTPENRYRVLNLPGAVRFVGFGERRTGSRQPDRRHPALPGSRPFSRSLSLRTVGDPGGGHGRSAQGRRRRPGRKTEALALRAPGGPDPPGGRRGHRRLRRPAALVRIIHEDTLRGGAGGRGYKARAGRIPQAYSTVRRGIRPSATM